MKNIKKVMSIIIAVCICFACISTGALAQGNNSNQSTAPNQAFVIYNGVRYNTDITHLGALLSSLGIVGASGVNSAQTSSQSSINTNKPMDDSYVYYWFDLLGSADNVYRSDLLRRITTVAYNDSQFNLSRELSWSFTLSATANCNLTAQIKSYLSAAVGGSLTYSTTGNDKYTFSIAPGYYGWMDYYPIMKHTWGNFCSQEYVEGIGWVNNSQYIDVYTPKSFNNQADGVYIPRSSTTAPSY